MTPLSLVFLSGLAGVELGFTHCAGAILKARATCGPCPSSMIFDERYILKLRICLKPECFLSWQWRAVCLSIFILYNFFNSQPMVYMRSNSRMRAQYAIGATSIMSYIAPMDAMADRRPPCCMTPAKAEKYPGRPLCTMGHLNEIASGSNQSLCPSSF